MSSQRLLNRLVMGQYRYVSIFFLVLVITATEVNVPSVICRVKRVRDPEEISALLVREAGNWRPANAIPNVQKGSSSQTSAVRNVIIIAARAKVSLH